MDFRRLLAALHLHLTTDDAKLIRVEFLVLLVGIFLVLAFILDAFRYRTKSAVIKKTLLLLDTVNNPLVNYTLGLIQNAPFTNEVLALWGVLLYNTQSDTNYVSSYGIPEQSRRRRTEFSDLLLFLLVVNLIASSDHNFKVLLWVLSLIQPVLVFFRIYRYDVALVSYSHGRNSEFMAEYLKMDCLENPASEITQQDMSWCKYIISGENMQTIESDVPNHQFRSQITDQTNCITVANIWGCGGRVLSIWDKENKVKDVCLSYSLYKILRCQTENIFLTRECYHKMQKLVFDCILHNECKDDDRVFRIFEIETAFLTDYSLTRYPLSVWYGFPIINIVTIMMKVIISFFLAFNLHNTQFDGDITHYLSKYNVDRFITYVLLFMSMLKEFWEISLYTFSDWNKVRIVCKYIRGHWSVRNRFMEHIAWYLCSTVFIKRWCKKMPQYSLLDKFDYSPWLKRILHYITLHMIRKPMEGGKKLCDVQIYKEVKTSIAEALRSMKRGNEIINFMPPLYECPISDDFMWACSQQTCSHLIWVWHIATSMCEIHLAISKKSDSKNFWYYSPLYWLRNISSKQVFLVDPKCLEENLRSNYIVANSLSRYCAYLVVFAPELLPDNKIFPRITFENTVTSARKLLKSRDSLESRYKYLIELGKKLEEQEGQSSSQKIKEDAEQSQQANPSVGIIEMAARLGYALIHKMEAEDRWKMLSEFWANTLVYMAPTLVSAEHEAQLQKGGEFIILLWALLTHCGIFEREEHRTPIIDMEEKVNNAENKGDDGEQSVGEV